MKHKYYDLIDFFFCHPGVTLFDMATLDLIAALKVEVPGISERGIRSAIQEVGKALGRVRTIIICRNVTLTYHLVALYYGNFEIFTS